jgi:feruloyl-CoA synthase
VRPELPAGETPVTVDWLPWSHAFGGNVNMHAALMRGSTLHIDSGAPLPGRFDQTVQNLREVCPTAFSSVPAAYPLLLEALERDPDFTAAFLSRLRTCAFGGAALNPSLVERFQAIAIGACGRRIAFGGGYGMTEASGIIALVYGLTDRTDLLGLPPPGMQLKLVRLEGPRWECRVRGPNIFSGYAGATDRSMFDDEGFFRTGDAVEFASAGHPQDGLMFAGRLGEDFKLANGTWVRSSRLREELLEQLRPLASDVVIVGENRSELAALVWSTLPASDVLTELRSRCREFNATRGGATQRIARIMLCQRPPETSAGELTAKGTINIRRLADNRRAEIECLYTTESSRV